MTSLTDRYVAATLRGIPEKQRADVERELRSSIADAVEDRVANGEERVAAETAVLEELGNPTKLAAGMVGRPLYLIGPELFIAYRHILLLLLGIVVPIVGVVQAIVAIGGDAGIGQAIGAGILAALSVAIQVAFWVTLAFAVVERVDPASWKDTDLKELNAPWTVKHLPDLPSSGAVSVGETAGEIVTLGISIGGLLYLRDWSWVSDAGGDPIPLFDPALWDFWFPVIIGVLVLQAVFQIVKLVIGRWTVGLAIVNAVLLSAVAIPFAVLALTGELINPAFADAIGWPQLAEGDSVAMLAVAAVSILVNGWEVVSGFRLARRRPQTDLEYAR
jgi:membrane glycosyltransferase